MQPYPFYMLTPEKILYQEEIVSLVAPGLEGYLGVMANHAPMVAMLKAGEVKITDANGQTAFFALSGGVLEVEKEEVILLADAAEKVKDIDVPRAQAAQARAAKRLTQPSTEIDVDRAKAALLRALNRLHLAKKRSF
jgi:F-type H+-transporting ATPase subunit epsilon